MCIQSPNKRETEGVKQKIPGAVRQSVSDVNNLLRSENFGSFFFFKKLKQAYSTVLNIKRYTVDAGS